MSKSKLKGWGCALVVIGFSAFTAHSLYVSLMRMEARHNTEMAILSFMKSNDGMWPTGWGDLKGDRIDKYDKWVEVAWHIDPLKLYEQDARPPHQIESAVPAIYFPEEKPEKMDEARWVLPAHIHRWMQDSDDRSVDKLEVN